MIEPFHRLQSTVIVVPRNDIDTDQIIPARYLKVTDKTGLGEGLFYAWRYRPDGRPDPDFPLNNPDLRQARILLAGKNFGCGSSREHAPWALMGWGLRAVISPSFADIFRSNALKNHLLPITIVLHDYQHLLALLEANPLTQLEIDLEQQSDYPMEGKSIFQWIPSTKLACCKGLILLDICSTTLTRLRRMRQVAYGIGKALRYNAS